LLHLSLEPLFVVLITPENHVELDHPSRDPSIWRSGPDVLAA